MEHKGSMVFTHVILRKVFRMEQWSSLAIQAVITIAEFMFIYSAQSGFYWYNGGIHYVGMHGFGLLFLSVAICLERAEGTVIFGATGGVMEAALRSAYYFLTGENPAPDAFKVVRGQDGVREAEVEIAGTKVRAAVVSGLGNTRRLIERIKKGEAEYDFVEVMACPGGCAGGGGQPIHDNLELAKERGDVLYELDAENEIRFSHENPAVQELYRSFLEKPLSHKSHELLHTDHSLGI